MLLKPLIAVVSCRRDMDNGYNDCIRETWGSEVPPAVPLKFFVGGPPGEARNAQEARDTVWLPCGDDYRSLPWKTREICQWALAHDFTHIFKCDTDTFAKPLRVLASNYHDFDYVGHFNGLVNGHYLGEPNAVYDKCYVWTSGGAGYWLSAKAAQLVGGHEIDDRYTCPNLGYPCEDLGVGQVLGPHITTGAIKARHDVRYGRSWRPDFKVQFTAHYCSEGEKRVFDTQWMRQHARANQ